MSEEELDRMERRCYRLNDPRITEAERYVHQLAEEVRNLQQQLAAAQERIERLEDTRKMLVAEVARVRVGLGERIAALTDENTYLRAENEKSLECIRDYAEGFRTRGEHLSHTRNELKGAQERIAALEHRQEHYRTMLEMTAGWLSIAPQASLEWIAGLGYEIQAALDETAADPLPCEERIAALEAENERLRGTAGALLRMLPSAPSGGWEKWEARCRGEEPADE